MFYKTIFNNSLATYTSYLDNKTEKLKSLTNLRSMLGHLNDKLLQQRNGIMSSKQDTDNQKGKDHYSNI